MRHANGREVSPLELLASRERPARKAAEQREMAIAPLARDIPLADYFICDGRVPKPYGRMSSTLNFL
jgi:hypothetical protein